MALNPSNRNVRRFFRINMPMRYFITPSAPITTREIFASGTQYFPSGVRNRLLHKKQQVLDSLDHIQEFKDDLRQIFTEIIQHIEFFGECCERISQGINPRLNLALWGKLQTHTEGFKHLKQIEQSSPKTFSHLKTIEDKYLYFLNRLIESLTKSSADEFYAPNYLAEDFRLDQLALIFKDEKYQYVPLVKTILYTAELMNAYTDIFRQMNDEQTLRHNPKQWPKEVVNVSASGLAVLTDKSYKLHERVDVLIYFDPLDKVLKFDGVVVNIMTDNKQNKERIALNFEFPDGKDQMRLQTEIQKFEIDECFEI